MCYNASIAAHNKQKTLKTNNTTITVKKNDYELR